MCWYVSWPSLSGRRKLITAGKNPHKIEAPSLFLDYLGHFMLKIRGDRILEKRLQASEAKEREKMRLVSGEYKLGLSAPYHTNKNQKSFSAYGRQANT